MIKIAKFCQKCHCPIYGKARKWCPDCARNIHLNQMSDYYKDHQSRWQFKGLYWDQQRFNQLGTAGLGEHAIIDDFAIELKKIEKEMIALGLRNKKENWRYKNV